MGLEVLAAAAIYGALMSAPSGLMAAKQITERKKGPKVPARSAAAEAADKELGLAAKRQGRASTLTTGGGGLSEEPRLGRASLLGSAGGLG